MPTERDVLRDAGTRLDQLRIEYMLTGSFAMNYYTIPRMTRDMDLVVAIRASHVPAFVAAFAQDYYVSDTEVLRAVARASVFNVIHTASAIKVACIVRNNSVYRVQIGVSMHETARTMVLASLPAGLSQAELLCALLERFYGHELSTETKAGFRQCVLQRFPPASA